MAIPNLFLFFLLALPVSSAPYESQHLLNFIAQFKLQNKTFRGWAKPTDPCSGDGSTWFGVICDKGRVWGLQLENMGLTGPVSLDSLKALSNFRTLSLKNNTLTGPVPDFSVVPGIKSLYLSNNRFRGLIPEGAFEGVRSLKKLHMAYNDFSGEIPGSVTKLTKLVELRLENNGFIGSVPDLPGVKLLNVSSNKLSGAIPSSFARMDATSFFGNQELCGLPLTKLCPSPSVVNEKKRSLPMTLLIVLSALITLMAMIALATIIRLNYRKATAQDSSLTSSTEAPEMPLTRKGDSKPEGRDESSNTGMKLTFLRDDVERFELGDLLKASAEILGSGWFGSSYKAGLASGRVMVVKRFRQMNNVDKEEFQEHMRRVGRLSHPNLLPLIAYYYRKDEKLIVTDYVANPSLALRLHGSKSQRLDWPARLKIVKGVAKGLSYLYTELQGLVTPHGNLKSSNVLLTETLDPVLSDYGLVPVTNRENAHQILAAYKSPEHLAINRVTKKTDVWCLGILILEILTGTFLEQNAKAVSSRDDSDLSSWVTSVTSQLDRSESVFDGSMEETCECEMVKLLMIGIECCEVDMDKRWDIGEALERIEGVKDSA